MVRTDLPVFIFADQAMRPASGASPCKNGGKSEYAGIADLGDVPSEKFFEMVQGEKYGNVQIFTYEQVGTICCKFFLSCCLLDNGCLWYMGLD